uniref:Uncharacterized protein n=1 Tax=Romanomermis culicivorax TaxID=13658 RepID=A0A915J4W9_ROMCU
MESVQKLPTLGYIIYLHLFSINLSDKNGIKVIMIKPASQMSIVSTTVVMKSYDAVLLNLMK